jgi:eukaryotic-like serine/threonine-protein kinase
VRTPPTQEGVGPTSAKGVRPGALTALLEELVRAPVPAAEAWESALRPGAVIGRFELVREVGRGGFGVVYEARDRELGRTVAFKAILAGPREVREERLHREAEAVACLSHPNIVTLYDVGRSDFGPYLVLELLHGRTLAARLDEGPLPVPEALRIGVSVARGLAHAHAQGVIHRDLNPGNIFLCDDGQVKVLDLGMALAFGRRKLEGGTPAFMAPEQWKGAPEDERTDVFALGVILYRMLAGVLPYPDDQGKSLLGSWARPELEVPGHPGLGRLVGAMLERDPVKRPRDVAAVLDPLSTFGSEIARNPLVEGAVVARRHPRRRRLALLAVVSLVVLAGAVALVLARRSLHHGVRAIPSIAVLPFADLSPLGDQEYFSDGLADEILNALTHVDGLHVVARSSAFAFKGKGEDLRSIGRALNVGTVLEGSVRKAGNRVRVTAQIVDVTDGYQLWSESFDRDFVDIFAVQDEIANAVVQALKVKVLPGRLPSTREHRTTSEEAYNQYLIGRQLYARFSQEGFRLAAEAYQKALALDPSYAPAWAGLAIQFSNLSEHEEEPDGSRNMRDRALAAANKAIALDPNLAEGYSARAILRAVYSWDWSGAQADIDRALALAPGDASIQRRYGILLNTLGRPRDAILVTRKAVAIDPLFAGNWLALSGYYLETREVDLARQSLERAKEIAPEVSGTEAMLGMAALLEGKPLVALANYAQCRMESERLVGEVLAHHDLGQAQEAREVLSDLTSKYGEKMPATIAWVHAWLGDDDLAFEWLDRAYEHHDHDLVAINELWVFVPRLRQDPRFEAMLKKLNMPVT